MKWQTLKCELGWFSLGQSVGIATCSQPLKDSNLTTAACDVLS